MYEFTILDSKNRRVAEVPNLDAAYETLLEFYRLRGVEPCIRVTGYTHGGGMFGYGCVQWSDEDSWGHDDYRLVLTIQLDAFECKHGVLTAP